MKCETCAKLKKFKKSHKIVEVFRKKQEILEISTGINGKI